MSKNRIEWMKLNEDYDQNREPEHYEIISNIIVKYK